MAWSCRLHSSSAPGSRNIEKRKLDSVNANAFTIAPPTIIATAEAILVLYQKVLYFKMSSGISPCFTSISLNVFRPTSKMTMPRSYGSKSNLGVALFKIFLLSVAYPIDRPPTTAAWYAALTSCLPSALGNLAHIEGVGLSV